MRPLFVTFFLFLSVSIAFGQSDRGTITGAVSDATGAVIPGANVVATNTETATRYETISTETGNYTLSQLPAGVYQLSVELPGFKRYVRQGITVLVAQTLRIDVALEVGAATDEVTVNADAPLLRTESSDVSYVIKAPQELPIFGVGGNQPVPWNWVRVFAERGIQRGQSVHRSWQQFPSAGQEARLRLYVWRSNTPRQDLLLRKL